MTARERAEAAAEWFDDDRKALYVEDAADAIRAAVNDALEQAALIAEAGKSRTLAETIALGPNVAIANATRRLKEKT